ncbi:MAG: NAD-binding protein, partial [Bacteroidota bacterium]
SLATDLHHAGQKLVVIENNPESVFLDRVRKEGIIVFISDGLDKNCWINAGLLRAKRFILVMDTDDKNIETARFISELCCQRKENIQVTGLVHMDNQHKFNLLKDYLDVQFGTTKLDINIFNMHQLAARRIWDIYPPHDPGKQNPAGAEIAILVAGYNETAEAFLVENMILSHYMDLERIRVLIVVPDREQVELDLKRKYPFMQKYLDYEVISQADDFFCNEEFIDDKDYQKLRRIYVFGEEDAEITLRAKKLKQCCYNRNYETAKKADGVKVDSLFYEGLLKEPQVIVCLPEKSSVVELLNYRPWSIINANESIADEQLDQRPFGDKLADCFNIILFRQFTDSFNKSYLVDENEMITTIAKVINYMYDIKYGFPARIRWLFEKAKIQHDPDSMNEIIKEIEQTLLNLNLTTNNPVREIEDAVFKKIRSAFNLPLDFPLEKLSINYRWQLLSDRLEDSNIYSARHSKIKLLYPHETDADFATLAPMEHTRWMAEKHAFQFRFGIVPLQKPLKPIAKMIKEELKLNHLMVPFDEIPEAEKDKDYDPYRLLKLIQQITKILHGN